jgi:hypothetical protein
VRNAATVRRAIAEQGEALSALGHSRSRPTVDEVIATAKGVRILPNGMSEHGTWRLIISDRRRGPGPAGRAVARLKPV